MITDKRDAFTALTLPWNLILFLQFFQYESIEFAKFFYFRSSTNLCILKVRDTKKEHVFYEMSDFDFEILYGHKFLCVLPLDLMQGF